MSFIYLNHLTIETTSPLTIGTGEREIGYDNQLIRDINKLPYLPATSIAGVWRNLTKLKLGETIAGNWFGKLGVKSRLTISQGYLLDTNNNTVKGLVTDELIESDPLLSYLKQASPIHRERVKLNDRGVAIEKGKFDQILIPSGVRFRLTIQWQGETEHDLDEFKEILHLWHVKQFAFGSDTNNGLGQVKLISQSPAVIHLKNNPSAGLELRTALNNTSNIEETPLLIETSFATLSLKAKGTWRAGKGSKHLSDKGMDINADIITYSEPSVEWTDNTARIAERTPLIPGSSWKGIIAHRFAYHVRRLKLQWAENLSNADQSEWGTRPAEADELFGFANERSGKGKAGLLIFHDAYIHNYSPVVRYHNTVDRFTGGVIQGALYSEELLEQPEFTLKITAKVGTTLTLLQRRALQATFDDMEIGLLPIGGGSGRGHSLTEKHGVWDINWDQITIRDENKEVEGAIK